MGARTKRGAGFGNERGHLIVFVDGSSHGPRVRRWIIWRWINLFSQTTTTTTPVTTSRTPSHATSTPPSTTMAKHSFSYPAIPASAPTSPAVVRKSDRNPPATPQRTNQRANVRHAHSPYTPVTTHSTPYTPLSLRSAPSSDGSTLVTPASANARRFSLSLSPEDSFQMKNGKKSLADIADNWRTRANENGIRVASGGESHFADDEGKSQWRCLATASLCSYMRLISLDRR